MIKAMRYSIASLADSKQSANPRKLRLLHTFRADNASAAEETLHVTFHKQRLEGEWFQLADEQRDGIIAITEFKEGYFLTIQGPVTANELKQN